MHYVDWRARWGRHPMICSLIIQVESQRPDWGRTGPQEINNPGVNWQKADIHQRALTLPRGFYALYRNPRLLTGGKMADRTNFVSCSVSGLNVEEGDVIFQHGGCAVFFKHRQVCAKNITLFALCGCPAGSLWISITVLLLPSSLTCSLLGNGFNPRSEVLCNVWWSYCCLVACSVARRCVHLHLNMVCLYRPSCERAPSFIALPEAFFSIFLPVGVVLEFFPPNRGAWSRCCQT